jgi:hypothetical protein
MDAVVAGVASNAVQHSGGRVQHSGGRGASNFKAQSYEGTANLRACMQRSNSSHFHLGKCNKKYIAAYVYKVGI